MKGLLLDTRQRAMLEEMGLKVWAPLRAADPVLPEPSISVDSAPARAADPRGVHRSVASSGPSFAPGPAVSAAPRSAPMTQPAGTPWADLDWPQLEQQVAQCQACGLCQGRKNTVFGVGNQQARWLVVGEAPGEQEDLQGEPFVGAAGQLLDNMLKALGLGRSAEGDQAVYIANVLKCRPPSNRNPAPEEVLRCEPFLRRQVALLQPQVILALGRFAAQSLLQDSVPDVAALPLGKLRGSVYQYEGVPVIVSYHPAYLLRTPHDKAKAWADLCLAHEVFHGTQSA